MPVIKVNDSSKETIKQFPIYVGVTQVKVVAINPDIKKLESLGYNVSQEPIYVTEQDEVKKVRLDFYVQNSKLRGKISFFLQDEKRMSSDKTKYEFINNYGQTTWASTLEEALNKTSSKNNKKWFNPEGAREAYVGESSLIAFLKEWLNTNSNDKVYIEDLAALFKGDVKELNFYVKEAANNVVWVLCTVSEKNGRHYQNVDNGIFVRASLSPSLVITKMSEYVTKKEKDNFPVKGYHGLEFKEFIPPIPKVVLPDQEEETPREPGVDDTIPF